MAKVHNLHSNQIKSPTDYVTHLLFFKDKQQQLSFNAFKYSQSNNSIIFFATQIFVTVLSFITNFAAWENFPSDLTLFNVILTVALSLIGWIIFIVRIVKRFKRFERFKTERVDMIIQYCESFWAFGHSLLLSLIIVVMAINGPCSKSDYTHTKGCNSSNEHHKVPDAVPIMGILFPALCAQIMNTRWEFTLFAFATNIVLSLFSFLHYDFPDSVPLFLSFAVMFSVLIYENQRQKIAVFLLTQNQKNLLEENERLAAETHANELRSMIGNVAHDLKTVSIGCLKRYFIFSY